MGRPVKYKKKEELQLLIDNYFSACKLNQQTTQGIDEEENKKILEVTDDVYPTVTGLALALDLTRTSLINYEGKEEFLYTIKKAKGRVEAFIEQRLYQNNATGCIFNLKNNFGWKDKSEVDNTIKLDDFSNMTDEQLEQEIINLTNQINGRPIEFQNILE